MATPANPTQLHKLENDAHECERNGDFLGALDAYEEIERQGWADAKHLAALGYCYIKNRQRQYARAAWLRGVQLEPASKLCREALDKHFPGWETKNAPPQPAHSLEVPPPPPPPASFGEDLTVETTSAVVTQSRAVREVVPEHDPFYKAPPAAHAAAARQAQPASPAARAGRPAAAPAARAEGGDARVNWDFVLQDAHEEAVVRIR